MTKNMSSKLVGAFLTVSILTDEIITCRPDRLDLGRRKGIALQMPGLKRKNAK